MRLDREKRTVLAMLRIYCRDRHGTVEGLCPVCTELHRYALLRLEKCRYGEDKPVCSECRTHCYRQEQRAQIKAVMRYAGPRMILHHPVLAVLHLLDQLKRSQDRKYGAK